MLSGPRNEVLGEPTDHSTTSRRSFETAFPDNADSPAQSAKISTTGPISNYVSLKLPRPIFNVGRGGSTALAFIVTMPKAALYEYREFGCRKNNVRTTRKIGPMQTKAESQFMQCRTYRKLRGCILRPDTAHHLATRRFAKPIRHRGHALRNPRLYTQNRLNAPDGS
jgi:hypothetical protein